MPQPLSPTFPLSLIHILGFNFYSKSPRYITPDDARRIAGRLPRRIQTAGVFVNAPAKDILKLARAVDLNLLQLHGNESPSSVQELAQHYPVIKACLLYTSRCV